jgi:hypothetical protein
MAFSVEDTFLGFTHPSIASRHYQLSLRPQERLHQPAIPSRLLPLPQSIRYSRYRTATALSAVSSIRNPDQHSIHEPSYSSIHSWPSNDRECQVDLPLQLTDLHPKYGACSHNPQDLKIHRFHAYFISSVEHFRWPSCALRPIPPQPPNARSGAILSDPDHLSHAVFRGIPSQRLFRAYISIVGCVTPD